MPRSILPTMNMNPLTATMNGKGLRMKRSWVTSLMEAKPNLKATRMHRLLISSPPNVRSSISTL